MPLPLRVRVGMYIDALELQDVDSRMPFGEGLDRRSEVWGSHFLEFGLGGWSRPDAEKK